MKRQSCHPIETCQMNYTANQLAGFYIMVTFAFNALKLEIVDKNRDQLKQVKLQWTPDI